MTGKTPDGKEIFRQSKIYMPIPQQFGRGDRMGRGPYEKSGMVRDTSIPAHKTVHETFEIAYPIEEIQKGDKVERTLKSGEITVDVELWYLPYGNKQQDPYLWHKFSKVVKISTTGK